MIFVVAVPPSIEVSDREVVVTERDTAELPCAAAGFPQPRISWIKDGRLSLDSATDRRYQLHDTGSLAITDVQVRLHGFTFITQCFMPPTEACRIWAVHDKERVRVCDQILKVFQHDIL